MHAASGAASWLRLQQKEYVVDARGRGCGEEEGITVLSSSLAQADIYKCKLS